MLVRVYLRFTLTPEAPNHPKKGETRCSIPGKVLPLQLGLMHSKIHYPQYFCGISCRNLKIYGFSFFHKILRVFPHRTHKESFFRFHVPGESVFAKYSQIFAVFFCFLLNCRLLAHLSLFRRISAVFSAVHGSDFRHRKHSRNGQKNYPDKPSLIRLIFRLFIYR